MRANYKAPKRNVWQVVNNGDTWQTADGTIIEITLMSPEHALNCIRMLERNALLYKYAAEVTDEDIIALESYSEINDDLPDGLFAELNGFYAEYQQEPLDWLRQTPVYLALQERAKKTGPVRLTIHNKFYKFKKRLGLV